MEVFLIFNSPTDYESYPTVIGFKSTDSDAQRIVERLTKEYKEVHTFYTEIQNAMQKYRLANPLPAQEKRLERTRWPIGIAQKDITQSMRDERKRIEDKNEMVYARNSKKILEYTIAMMDSIKGLLLSKDQKWVEKNFTIGASFITPNFEFLDATTPYYIEVCEELVV